MYNWERIRKAIESCNQEQMIAERRSLLKWMECAASKCLAKSEPEYNDRIERVMSTTLGRLIVDMKLCPDDMVKKFQYSVTLEYLDKHGFEVYYKLDQMGVGDYITYTLHPKKLTITNTYTHYVAGEDKGVFQLCLWNLAGETGCTEPSTIKKSQFICGIKPYKGRKYHYFFFTQNNQH